MRLCAERGALFTQRGVDPIQTGCLRSVALTVVTAQVFLVANLHEYVAVGAKTKEGSSEDVEHAGAASGETQEQADAVGSN